MLSLYHIRDKNQRFNNIYVKSLTKILCGCIINTTDMADVGGSIKINSKYLRTDTYEIKAIGNKAYLESSIFGKGGYAEQLNTTGIKTDIERKNKIKITKYDGELNTKYIKEVN